MDVKANEANNEQQLSMDHERQNNRDSYSFMGNQTNFISGFGQYPIKEIGRFDVEKFTPRF